MSLAQSPKISNIYTDQHNVTVFIHCSNSSPTRESVYLYGNGTPYSKGIRISNSDPVVRGGVIWNFERGIDIYGGNPDIRDVNIYDNTRCGIACNWYENPPPFEGCNPCSASIAYNRIMRNKIGIASVNASPTIWRNRILENDSVGVYCSGTAIPKLGEEYLSDADSGYNEICNDLWNIYSECSGTVKAENNWWGMAPPDTSKFYGDIDYIPYLFQSPDRIPPARITDLSAALVDSCIALQWSAVSIDTTGKEDPVNFYAIYRDTTAGFSSPPAESLVVVDTTGYIDFGVVGDISVNYFYSVRAVDYGLDFSLPSNQVGEFDNYLTNEGTDSLEFLP